VTQSLRREIKMQARRRETNVRKEGKAAITRTGRQKHSIPNRTVTANREQRTAKRIKTRDDDTEVDGTDYSQASEAEVEKIGSKFRVVGEPPSQAAGQRKGVYLYWVSRFGNRRDDKLICQARLTRPSK
jgi:hypothetical protein